MRMLVSYANGSDTSLMMMRSVEKAMKELGVPITKVHHCTISEGKSSVSQCSVVLTPVNSLQMLQQAKERGVIVIGIKNVMSVKEIQKEYMVSEHYQKSE